MPTYTFRRIEDEGLVERRMSMTDFQRIKAGELGVTDADGCPLELVFDASQVGFVLKDGPSGGWATKAGKERRYRKDRHRVMGQRQRDHVHKTTLQPNYEGKIAPTWADAQDAARTDKGVAAARTYDSLVAKEKK